MWQDGAEARTALRRRSRSGCGRGNGVEHGLLPSTSMTPTPKKPVPEPEREKPEDVDFAGEAGPKETEFGDEKDAKDLTAGGFDPIP